MKVREYFDLIGLDLHGSTSICFVMGEYIKPTPHTGYFAYHNSPLRWAWEWRDSKVLDYNILNTKQNVTYWLSGSDWNGMINRDEVMSLLVVSDEEYEKYAGSKVGRNWHSLVYIENEIRQQVEKGENVWANKFKK